MWFPVLLLVLIVGAIIFSNVFKIPVNLWLTANFSGAKVGILKFLVMRSKGIDPAPIVRELIVSTQAGLSLTVDDLITHHLMRDDIKLL
ncbi:MAG: flotillin-like FloA family protein, partial [Bacteroidota bacterium]